MVLISVLIFVCGLWGILPLQAESVTVRGVVSITHKSGSPDKPENSNAVVWLKPVTGSTERDSEVRPSAHTRYKIVQQHKRFEPRVLAIPVGSQVDFPNLDPFFHNVFSMYDGKRFDLGLYEAGASHSVTFDTAGVCYIFCNIHPEMSAVVVVVNTPYYAVTNQTGEFSIAGVPTGRYLVSAWHERGKPEVATEFPFNVTISPENTSLRTIRLVDSGQVLAPHKNKYGRDYENFSSSNPVYK